MVVTGKKIKSKKKNKVIPKKVKILCKKYHIRLTTKKGSKKIKKSICILLRELKKKTRSTKGTSFGKRQRRRFGDDEKPAEVEKNLSKWAKTKKFAKEHPKKFAAMIVAPIALAGIAVVAGPAILTALSASSAASAGAGGALTAGSTALSAGENALHGAKTAKTLIEKEQQLSAASRAFAAAQSGFTSAVEGTQNALTAVNQGVETLQKVKETVGNIQNVVPTGQTIGELTNVIANTPAFGKRNRSRFGENLKKYPQFGKSKFGHSNYIPAQQVMNFGMTKQRAMKIIRDLYRKNCKNV